MKYPDSALERAKDGALEWLKENHDGYPRSWPQEKADEMRRGYPVYDEFEAPPLRATKRWSARG